MLAAKIHAMHKPMRIAFICPGLGHGGAETQIIAMAAGLARQGHEVCTLVLFPGTARVAQLRALGVRVVEFEKRRRLDLGLVLKLRAELAAFSADVVHGFLFDGNLYARLAGWGQGMLIVSSERNSDYTLRASQQLAHRLTRWMTDEVIANSHCGAALARTMFPRLADDHVHVVWNGIDWRAVRARATAASGLRAQIGLPATTKIVGFVGAIKPQKDYELAIETVKTVVGGPGSDWAALFVGARFPKVAPYWSADYEGSRAYAATIEQRFAGLPADKVFRLGQIDNAVEVMAECNVLLSTSRHEGFPNVVLEAMAAGTPVVSTRYSDIDRILPMRWQVVASGRAAELAGAVLRAERERAALVQAQRLWVEKHADIDALVEQLSTLYGRCRLTRHEGA